MTYISRTWKVWRPISRQLGSTWKVWRPISRQLGSTWKVWRPIKTIGQYLEGLAPQTREFPLKFGCKRLAKNFKYHFCPPLVFISIKSLFEDVPLWMMENNLDKLRSIEDKLNKVFIFYLQPIVLARIYKLQHVVRL